MKFKGFYTRDDAKLLRQELEKIKIPGCSVTVGSIRYGGQEASAKITVVAMNSKGEIEDPTILDFKRNCTQWGLSPTDLGKQFTLGGKIYTIVGSKSSKWKRPIIGMRGDGKRFIFEPEIVQRNLKP